MTSPREPEDDTSSDLPDWQPLGTPRVTGELRSLLGTASHLEIYEELLTSDTLLSVPKSDWLIHRLGLSIFRMKEFILIRLLHTGEWLSPAQWDFLVNLIHETKLEVSPSTEKAKQRRDSNLFEFQLDLVLVSLLQLLPPGSHPSLDFIEGLKIGLQAVTKFSTFQNERTYRGFLPVYGKALSRIIYQPQQHRKLRPTRRKRSSEDSHGAKVTRSRGPRLVSRAPILYQIRNPFVNYIGLRDSLIRLTNSQHYQRTGTTLAEGLNEILF